METNNIYFHKGQLRSILVDANTEYIVAGRGWGKSEGPGGKRTSDWANNMPRCAIGIVGATYMQLLDRTLPPLFRAWERLGYRRNVHFWVRQKPPKHLNIPLPFYAPDTDAHTIYWWNGACFKLISQDRPGSANGTTLDALYGDEAKLLNKTKFDQEISKANRGNVREFGDYAGHHGILFMTDMPTSADGKWILDKKLDLQLDIQKGDKMMKMYELNALILNLQLKLNKLLVQRHESAKAGIAPAAIKLLNISIRSIERTLNELRKETVNFVEGPSLENIHFLGLETIKKWKRDDLDIDFQTQVLNQQIYSVSNKFYESFETDDHCYDQYDYTFVDSLGMYLPNGIEQSCLTDGDLQRTQPIDIALDAGARINCLIAGQESADCFKFLKSFYVTKPKLISDVVEDFCKYYDRHSKKEVNFYYDHTFIGTDATRLYTYADSVKNALVKNKWQVNMVNIGMTSLQDTRYRMWSEVFRERNPMVKPVRFNRNNCKQLIIAMQLAGAIQVKDKRSDKTVTNKDKRPERNTNVPAQEATHLTDAMDTLYVGRFQHRLGYTMSTTEAYFGTD
ncbi:hypothetical protein [Mucilaginibacter sp.]